MNEVDIIKGAREILSDPWHWRKGGYTDGAGRYCLLGAMGMVAYEDAHAFSMGRSLVMRAADMVAKHATLEFNNTIANFNDDPLTTHQDVLNLLDKTLADLGAL